jgi:hypothetical protein
MGDAGVAWIAPKLGRGTERGVPSIVKHTNGDEELVQAWLSNGSTALRMKNGTSGSVPPRMCSMYSSTP